MFLEADPDLCGDVFKVKHNQSDQVVNFTTVDEITKAQAGTECDPFVRESLEKEVKSGPEEPTFVVKDGGTMKKTEEMKCRSKYDKHNQRHKVKMQLKQTYSRYY